MAYCKNCGAELPENIFFCPSCGTEINPQTPVESTYRTYTTPQQTTSPDDSGNIGWGVLGFCFPLVGLILFLIWKNNKPKNAKKAIVGAAISVGISIVCSILSGIGSAMMV